MGAGTPSFHYRPRSSSGGSTRTKREQIAGPRPSKTFLLKVIFESRADSDGPSGKLNQDGAGRSFSGDCECRPQQNVQRLVDKLSSIGNAPRGAGIRPDRRTPP
jgi:hypothetical protein